MTKLTTRQKVEAGFAFALTLGLRVEEYNSGVARNPLNGFRVFQGTARADYFSGAHLQHHKTGAELLAFLKGYAENRTLPTATRTSKTHHELTEVIINDGVGYPDRVSTAERELDSKASSSCIMSAWTAVVTRAARMYRREFVVDFPTADLFKVAGEVREYYLAHVKENRSYSK